MTLLAEALAYLQAGITSIPIALDGSKAPAQRAGLWRKYIKRPPTEKETRAMFAEPSGIAVIGGATSGGLEIIDFDLAECFAPWSDLVNDIAPDLLARLPVVKTPNGYHVYYRCEVIEGNQKLAKSTAPWKDETGKEHTTKIETRGEGGYVIAPPSAGAVHPTGRAYALIGAVKSLADTPTLTAAERLLLLDCARAFNEVAQETKADRASTSTLPRGKGRAGDEFSERVSWDDILVPHGWSIIRQVGSVTHWQRPGKNDKGISATTGFTGDKLYVFSSNAQPFESQRAYGKFSAYGHLNHSGDFKAASLELQARGFGEQKAPPKRSPASDAWAQLGATEGGGAVRMEKPEAAPIAAQRPLAIVPPVSSTLTAAQLEEMLDDDPAAAMRPGVFEQLLAMRSDRAEWTLINDVLRRKHKKQDFLAAVKKHDAAQKKQEASDGWRAKLQYKEAKDGSQILEKCVTNLALILEFDPAWRGVLRMNTFSKKITVDAKRCPFNRQDLQWSDADTIAVKVWLETHYPLRPTTNDVHEAILHVCTNARFNPLTDYLDSLDPAPEKEILDMWLIDFFGADDTPYTRAVGARWMIGAVARAMSPGCKVDAVLILEGKQGLKKSSVLEKLCPDPTWFTDGLSDFGSKDQKEEIEGKWIVELGELKGFGKELEQIKAFVTRKSENYRPAYARHEINSPRTCVFAGTVNPSGDGFLRDVTGNRRFWPVSCVKQAPELTPHLRDQLWAEAKARYLAGEKWWIEEEETELLRSAAEQQNSRVEVDVWHEQVSVFVAGNDKVSANDVLEMLKVSTEKRGQREAQRVGRIMKMLGWEKYRDSGDGRPWRYRPTEEAEHRRQRTLF